MKLQPDQRLCITEFTKNDGNGIPVRYPIQPAEIQHQAISPLLRALTTKRIFQILANVDDDNLPDIVPDNIASIFGDIRNKVLEQLPNDREAQRLVRLIDTLSIYQNSAQLPTYGEKLAVYNEIRNDLKISMREILMLMKNLAEKLEKLVPGAGIRLGGVNDELLDTLVTVDKNEALTKAAMYYGSKLSNVVALDLPPTEDSGTNSRHAVAD